MRTWNRTHGIKAYRSIFLLRDPSGWHTKLTLSNMSRILCRISGAPRSASAIASGHSGSAGHAIADKCNGSTNRGDCKQEWKNKNAISCSPTQKASKKLHPQQLLWDATSKRNCSRIPHPVIRLNPLRNSLSLSPSSKNSAYQKSNTSESLSDPWSPWWSNITQDNVLIRCDPYIKFILFYHTP